MTTYLCAISPHDSSDARSERFLTEADNEDAALFSAFLHGLDLEVLEVNQDDLRAVVAQAKRNKEAPFRNGNEDAGCSFVLWYRPEDKNIGYGESRDGTEAGLRSRENHWITIAEWRPDPIRRQELESWTKEALIEHVLRTEAVQ